MNGHRQLRANRASGDHKTETPALQIFIVLATHASHICEQSGLIGNMSQK